MAGLSATSGGGFDYIQSATPADPEKGELWFDSDGGTDGNGEVKVYDGNEWDTTGYVSHDQLLNVSAGDHFTPGSGLTFNSGTLALLLSSYLTIDGNGDLALASGSVGQDRLAFDTATQSELNGHESDSTNPHNVTDSQTGAASALSNHAGDSTAHHTKPTTPTVVDSGEVEENTTIDSVSLKLDSGTWYVVLWNGTTAAREIAISAPSNPSQAWVAWYKDWQYTDTSQGVYYTVYEM